MRMDERSTFDVQSSMLNSAFWGAQTLALSEVERAASLFISAACRDAAPFKRASN